MAKQLERSICAAANLVADAQEEHMDRNIFHGTMPCQGKARISHINRKRIPYDSLVELPAAHL